MNEQTNNLVACLKPLFIILKAELSESCTVKIVFRIVVDIDSCLDFIVVSSFYNSILRSLWWNIALLLFITHKLSITRCSGHCGGIFGVVDS